MEVSFVDESEFVIYGKGFIFKDYADNLDWEVDSTISLEGNDSLDEISDFEEELRSGAEDSDPDSELSSSLSATYDKGDGGYFGAGPSAPNKGGRKKPKAKSKQRAGNINRRTKKSKQPNDSLSACEAPSTRNSNKNKNTKKHQANRGGNKKKKATKMLTKKELDEVMMKLEGKRPMCWNFVSEQLSKQPVMKHLENHRKLIEEILEARYSELRNLVDHMFSVYMEHLSAVAEEAKKDHKVHLTLRWMNTPTS